MPEAEPLGSRRVPSGECDEHDLVCFHAENVGTELIGARIDAEVFIYPGAEHAFAQPLFNRGKTYDPVAAEVAWRLSEDFLKRRLQ